jgi:hypothetical protein
MTFTNGQSRQWKFTGIQPAQEKDVEDNQRLRNVWAESVAQKLFDPPLPEPTEVKLGDPLAVFNMPNANRRMPAKDVQEYLETAELFPEQKSHQINALKAAASALKVGMPG